MKKLFLAACLLLSACLLHAQGALPRPKLVVGVVVDQMRWDYLYRYYDLYGEGGFKRLLGEGVSCENTQINYIPTVTAIGHSSVYTGSVPAIHGITGNSFLVESTGQWMYCTEDHSVQSVGGEGPAGEMSPRNLLASTVTDELRLATNFHAKTIGVALKDRGAILPAGHAATAAYWFDDDTGKWITSTYYMEQLPAWVEAFNGRDLAAHYLNQDWNLLYPAEAYTQSTPDDNRYERPFTPGDAPVFPILTSQLFKEQGYGLIRTTPFGNTLTLDMAKAVVENERMGQGTDTDFLAVSLSSTDYIGHQFGVNAVEIEDTYLRLDKDLGEFLSFLDDALGEGNYTLFLTADHGAAHNINFMKDHGIPADKWTSDLTRAALDSLLQTKYGVSGALRSLDYFQVHLDRAKLDAADADFRQVKADIIRLLQAEAGVAYVIDMERAAEATVPEAVRERVVNGYCRERSGVIQVIVEPGWYDVSSTGTPLGTSHSVWNPYDAHIPLLFYGWGVNGGGRQLNREVYITDIAPTVAALLHIQMPNGCIGKPIEEVISH
ncbi:MAG: alkaline phosphatase family protein [Prevotellaceae bacterium]|nr:alkaline phosphatase family protein [Prevotellaceae bacterium]